MSKNEYVSHITMEIVDLNPEQHKEMHTALLQNIDRLKDENKQLSVIINNRNKVVAELTQENQQLKLIIKRTKASGNYPGRVSAYKARIINLSEENQQLKELIKEIRSLWKGTICMPDSQEQVRDILIKIDNVIGEKK